MSDHVPADDACLAADWANWALNSLAIALARLEALGEEYPPDYEQLDRQARNVVAAIRDRNAADEGETPCVSCHRVGVHALNCPNRSVPVEGEE